MHRASCQCGNLVVSASNDPDFVIACNCKYCQHRTGSPFGVGGYFQRQYIDVNGTAKTWERTADSGRSIINHFCPNCGTTMYWELEMRPDHIGVASGAFEAPLPEPARAIWTEAKHDWVEFPSHWPTFPQGTPE